MFKVGDNVRYIGTEYIIIGDKIGEVITNRTAELLASMRGELVWSVVFECTPGWTWYLYTSELESIDDEISEEKQIDNQSIWDMVAE